MRLRPRVLGVPVFAAGGEDQLHEDGGEWHTSGSDLVIHWSGDEEAETSSYRITDAGRLEVDAGHEVDYDFDGDGSDEPATLVIQLINPT